MVLELVHWFYYSLRFVLYNVFLWSLQLCKVWQQQKHVFRQIVIVADFEFSVVNLILEDVPRKGRHIFLSSFYSFLVSREHQLTFPYNRTEISWVMSSLIQKDPFNFWVNNVVFMLWVCMFRGLDTTAYAYTHIHFHAHTRSLTHAHWSHVMRSEDPNLIHLVSPWCMSLEE